MEVIINEQTVAKDTFVEDCFTDALIFRDSCSNYARYSAPNDFLRGIKTYLDEQYPAYKEMGEKRLCLWRSLCDVFKEEHRVKTLNASFQLTAYYEAARAWHAEKGKQIAMQHFFGNAISLADLQGLQAEYRTFLAGPVAKRRRQSAVKEIQALQKQLASKQEQDLLFRYFNLTHVLYQESCPACVVAGYELETLWLMRLNIKPPEKLTAMMHQQFACCNISYDNASFSPFMQWWEQAVAEEA